MKRSPPYQSTQQSPQEQKETIRHETEPRKAQENAEKETLLEKALDDYEEAVRGDASLTPSAFARQYPTRYRASVQRYLDVASAIPDFGDDGYPENGDSFSGFEILDLLGVGAIARVYLAAELRLGGRFVALKVSHFGNHEAETLGKLTYPHVVPVHSLGEDAESGLTAICMPYLGSVTLADVIFEIDCDGQIPKHGQQILEKIDKLERVPGFCHEQRREKTVDPRWRHFSYYDGIALLGMQLARALSFTHEAGVLHRDLKPSNVLVTPVGEAMLLDFNLSSDLRTEISRWGGTLPYMPPEQLSEMLDEDLSEPNLDPRSDIFSLGVILYEALTGKLPFEMPPPGLEPEQTARYLLESQHRPPKPLVQVCPGVDRRIADLVEQCLSLSPDDRPLTAQSLDRSFQEYLQRQERLRARRRSRRRILKQLAVVTFAAAPLGMFWWTEHRPSLGRALRQLRQRDWEAAHLEFESILKRSDSNAALLGRGVVSMYTGEFDKAIPDLQAGAAGGPTVHKAIAYCALMAEVPQVAAYWLKHASRNSKDPDSQLHLGRAFALSRYGQHLHALEEVEAALKIDPDSQLAYHLRARIANALLQQSKQEIQFDCTPVDDIRQALSLGPSSRLLELDAAHTLALQGADGGPATQDIRRHLTAACRLGLTRGQFERIAWAQRWQQATWYQELAEKCPEVEQKLDNPFCREPELQDLVSTIQNLGTEQQSQATPFGDATRLPALENVVDRR